MNKFSLAKLSWISVFTQRAMNNNVLIFHMELCEQPVLVTIKALSLKFWDGFMQRGSAKSILAVRMNFFEYDMLPFCMLFQMFKTVINIEKTFKNSHSESLTYENM